MPWQGSEVHCHAGQDSHRGKRDASGAAQTLPQHSNGPKLQRQKTLLQRVVGTRLTHAATMRFAPIKHDADYAGALCLAGALLQFNRHLPVAPGAQYPCDLRLMPGDSAAS